MAKAEHSELQSWAKIVGTLVYNCTLFSHPSPPTSYPTFQYCISVNARSKPCHLMLAIMGARSVKCPKYFGQDCRSENDVVHLQSANDIWNKHWSIFFEKLAISVFLFYNIVDQLWKYEIKEMWLSTNHPLIQHQFLEWNILQFIENKRKQIFFKRRMIFESLTIR